MGKIRSIRAGNSDSSQMQPRCRFARNASNSRPLHGVGPGQLRRTKWSARQWLEVYISDTSGHCLWSTAAWLPPCVCLKGGVEVRVRPLYAQMSFDNVRRHLLEVASIPVPKIIISCSTETSTSHAALHPTFQKFPGAAQGFSKAPVVGEDPGLEQARRRLG